MMNPYIYCKKGLSYIANYLAYIINNSLTYGIYLDDFKLAFINPVNKKGDISMHENYRPISLLPWFSEIFELPMYNRLILYYDNAIS